MKTGSPVIVSPLIKFADPGRYPQFSQYIQVCQQRWRECSNPAKPTQKEHEVTCSKAWAVHWGIPHELLRINVPTDFFVEVTKIWDNWATAFPGAQKPHKEEYLDRAQEVYTFYWSNPNPVSTTEVAPPTGAKKAPEVTIQKSQVKAPQAKSQRTQPMGEAILYWAVTNPWTVILLIIIVGGLFYAFDWFTNHSGLVDPLLAAIARGEYVSDFTLTVNRIWATILTISEVFISLFWYVLYRGFIKNPKNIAQNMNIFILTLVGFALSCVMLYVDTYISAVAVYGPTRVPPLNEVSFNNVDVLVWIAAVMPTPVQALIFEYLRLVLEKRRTERVQAV